MKRLILVLVLVLLATSVFGDQLYKVALHSIHTVNSDGYWTFVKVTKMAKLMGYDVLVINDHLEQICQKSSFAQYLADCDQSYCIKVVPGVEVTAEKAHTVVFGDLTVEAMEDMNRQTTIQGVIKTAHRYGLICVAAHPFDAFDPFVISHAKGIDFHEWYNDKNIGVYGKNLDWAKQMISDSWKVGNTSGMDSHSSLDPQDLDRWSRPTWVYAKSSSRNDLMAAFRNGQTIAASKNYRLANLNIAPGFDIKKVEPHFVFTVKPTLLAETTRVINIYRDNQVVMTQKMLINTATKQIDFRDSNCPPGMHTYLVEVEGVLITSPYYFEVANEMAEKNVITQTTTNFTGGSPILIGKTDVEIKKIMNKEPATYRIYGNHDNGWRFTQKPMYPFMTDIEFEKFDLSRTSSDPRTPVYNTAQWVSLEQGSGCYSRGITARRIVPSEILNSTPVEICWYPSFNYEHDGLMVIWNYQGNTFALGVRDSRKNVVELKLGENHEPVRWTLTAAGKDFRNADDAYVFVQILGIQNLLGHKDWYEGETAVNGCPIADRGNITDGSFYRFSK